MTTISSVAGLTANCTFEPPVSTPDGADDAMAWIAQLLVLAVGERLLRSDRSPESPVWTPIGSMFSIEQTITTLSAAVAHHLELELAPAEHRLVDQHLADRRGREALRDDPLELLSRAGDPAAAAAERERRADDQRQPELAAAACASSSSSRSCCAPCAAGACIVASKSSRSSARQIAS
jgi:hypothetical protein